MIKRIIYFNFCLLLLLKLSTQVMAGDTFHALPLPAPIYHIEINESEFSPFATMRFATQQSPEAILAFYQKHLGNEFDLSVRRFQKTIIIAVEIEHVKKMISITDYSGLADVVLQSDQ
jgi:hypothetical protein